MRRPLDPSRPVLADARHELALGGDRVHEEVVAAAVRPRAPREVVDVEVRDGGRHDRPPGVEHRVVNERDRERLTAVLRLARTRLLLEQVGPALARFARAPARGATRDLGVVAARRGAAGTRAPRNSAGRVYCGYSSSPPVSGLCDSSRVEASLPRTPGRQARARLDDGHRRHLAAGHHEVAQRDLLVDVRAHALVEALVAPADEHDGGAAGELARPAPGRAGAPAASAARGAARGPSGRVRVERLHARDEHVDRA